MFLHAFASTLPVWATLSVVCSFLGLLGAYSLTACSDPGYIRPGADNAGDAEKGGMTFCSICSVYRPPGAQHCYDCECCVEELDHHCPWTGKCIGKYNLKFFYAFLKNLPAIIC